MSLPENPQRGRRRASQENDNLILVALILQEIIHVGVVLAPLSIAEQCVHVAFIFAPETFATRSRCLSFPSKRKNNVWNRRDHLRFGNIFKSEASKRTNFTWGRVCDSSLQPCVDDGTRFTPVGLEVCHQPIIWNGALQLLPLLHGFHPLSITTTESNHS
jgi:hypothetical protein